MPNWVYNEVTLRSDKKTIAKVKRLLTSKGSKFDFNKVLPMPKEIKDQQDKSKKIFNENAVNINGILYKKGTTQADLDRLVAKYGYSNWYDWNIANWGTKWGAKESDLIAETETELEYVFNTAWGTPTPIFEALVQQFPSLEIEVRAEYEGDGVATYNFVGINYWGEK